jgi:hypothetical protein
MGAVFRPEHAEAYRSAVPQADIITVAGQAHGIHGDPEGRGPYLDALRGFLAAVG